VTAVAVGEQQAGTRSQPAGLVAARCAATSFVLLGLLIVGFVGYLLVGSRIQETSAQSRLYTTFAGQLGQDIGPLGPVKPGAPVAVIDIPGIALANLVVVEGTSPEDLTLGPGHVRNTPLPGQLGLSVIYGRRATFGAPFARLDSLKLGDKITVITHPVKDPTLNRLVLLTASSAVVPAFYVEVDADLITTVHDGPVAMPAIGPAERALAGDTGALVMTMIWGFALALVGVGGAWAAARWSPWPVYLVVTPIVLAVVWNLYENCAALLPNLY
jgi:sortase A